jgi:hypothetical protein
MRHAALQHGGSRAILVGREQEKPMTIRSRIKSAISQLRADPVERYLSEATSLVDLEAREREVSRGRFTPRKHY